MPYFYKRQNHAFTFMTGAAICNCYSDIWYGKAVTQVKILTVFALTAYLPLAAKTGQNAP
jgi:hypothetical protein